MDGFQLSAVITSIATPIVVIFTTVWTNRKVEAVHKEVKTMNAQTIGELVDNTETRRVEDIPMEDRTWKERDHMHSVEKQEKDK